MLPYLSNNPFERGEVTHRIARATLEFMSTIEGKAVTVVDAKGITHTAEAGASFRQTMQVEAQYHATKSTQTDDDSASLHPTDNRLIVGFGIHHECNVDLYNHEKATTCPHSC